MELIFNIFKYPSAVRSGPVTIPGLKYGFLIETETKDVVWNWVDVLNPMFNCSTKVIVIYLFIYL